MSVIPNDVKKAQPVIEERFHTCKNFTWKIAATDVAAGALTALCTSTIVSMIDKTIMEKTLGLRPSIVGGMNDGLKTFFTTPWRFFFPTTPPNNYSPVYWLVFLTYSMTYISGNLVQSYRESQGETFYLEKFTAGSVTNVVFTLVKDNQMLKFLPPPGKPLPVPNLSRFLFVIRDSLTVLGSFWVAPLLRDYLVHNTDMSYRQCSDVADLTVPASIQFISTPLHLYGIALKENPKFTQAELLKLVGRDYLPAVCARMCRIVPAFGFGMMAMKRMRSGFQENVEGPNEPSPAK